MFITTEEIAWKLFRKRSVWTCIPKVSVVTVPGIKFGKIIFDFSEPGETNQIESIQVLLVGQDKDQIEKMAKEAVERFKDIIDDIYNKSE